MRPTWILTKGERTHIDGIAVDLHERYRAIQCAMFEWTGLPEGCPPDLPERALYDFGGLGLADSSALGRIVTAGRMSRRDHYGRVVQWTPVMQEGYADPTGQLMKTQTSPMLEINATAELVFPYLDAYQKALKSLRANVFAMAQPVLLEGDVANNVEGKLITWELESGKVTIPSLANRASPYKVLDLGVKDWTHSLIGAMDAMDREILTIMGVRNSGTEKASGITSEETLSVKQQLVMTAEQMLIQRQEWCARVNVELGTELSVRLSDIYLETRDAVMQENAEGSETDDK